MARFTADFSSSQASTPNFKANDRLPRRNETPELASTTPLAPPPSNPFGSSAFNGGSNVSKLRFQQNANDTPAQSPTQKFGFSTMTQTTDNDGYLGDYTQDMLDDDDDYSYTDPYQKSSQPTFMPVEAQSLIKFSQNTLSQSLSRSSRRNSSRLAQYSALPNGGNDKFIPGLIRDVLQRSQTAPLTNDPDQMIAATENIMRSVAEEEDEDEQSFGKVLFTAAREVENTWQGQQPQRKRRRDEALSIGPGRGAPPFEKARFIGILLLQLYNHSNAREDEDGAISMPQLLLDWMNDHHSSLDQIYSEVTETKPNVTQSDLFWDLLEGLIARGKFQLAMGLLAEADFAYATKEGKSGFIDARYNGMALQTIGDAVLTLRRVLNSSPAVQSQDFSLNGPDWNGYKRDVEDALESLRENTDTHDDSELREAEEEGHLTLPGKSLPYEIFTRLQTVYNILLGSAPDLISVANDWLEATMYLTIWWNGTPDSKVQQWSFDVSRAQHPNQEHELSPRSYLTRLKDSLLCVTNPVINVSELAPLNPQSAFELTLAAVLQGDLTSALKLLQTFSLCVTSTVAEIGTWSGWLTSYQIPEGLDDNDLMVLDIGSSKHEFQKDDILELYSRQLFQRDALQTVSGVMMEGWEFAIAIISRCESTELASTIIREYLSEITVQTARRAGGLMALLNVLGLRQEAKKVSEQYGDHLVNDSNDYGTALLCYARSNAEQKVRQLVDMMSSYCLVQSQAYPAETDMDDSLKRLVSDPQHALADIAEQEPDAAAVLQFYLVGYACLRRFYTIRDGSSDQTLAARKKQAAKALIAAISSAADCIYGGLYDSERQSAIQVDGLLTLLGEATALTAQHNDGKPLFSSDQLYSLLAAVEDLQTVNDRVYSAAEDCLSASLRQFNGSNPPSPHAMLKKSISSGTASNFSFSMMGSEMLGQSSESLGGKSLGSAVLVSSSGSLANGQARQWDWRSNFKGREVNGEEVLRYLRRSIAHELSIASLVEGYY